MVKTDWDGEVCCLSGDDHWHVKERYANLVVRDEVRHCVEKNWVNVQVNLRHCFQAKHKRWSEGYDGLNCIGFDGDDFHVDLQVKYEVSYGDFHSAACVGGVDFQEGGDVDFHVRCEDFYVNCVHAGDGVFLEGHDGG